MYIGRDGGHWRVRQSSQTRLDPSPEDDHVKVPIPALFTVVGIGIDSEAQRDGVKWTVVHNTFGQCRVMGDEHGYADLENMLK